MCHGCLYQRRERRNLRVIGSGTLRGQRRPGRIGAFTCRRDGDLHCDGVGCDRVDELFGVCRASNLSGRRKNDAEKYRIVTTTWGILARAAPCRNMSVDTAIQGGSGGTNASNGAILPGTATLQRQLLRFCTCDGTPEQARNSVFAAEIPLAGTFEYRV